MKMYDCDGCYKGPFLEKELVFKYGFLLCSKCYRIASRKTFKEIINKWNDDLKEFSK